MTIKWNFKSCDTFRKNVRYNKLQFQSAILDFDILLTLTLKHSKYMYKKDTDRQKWKKVKINR